MYVDRSQFGSFAVHLDIYIVRRRTSGNLFGGTAGAIAGFEAGLRFVAIVSRPRLAFGRANESERGETDHGGDLVVGAGLDALYLHGQGSHSAAGSAARSLKFECGRVVLSVARGSVAELVDPAYHVIVEPIQVVATARDDGAVAHIVRYCRVIERNKRSLVFGADMKCLTVVTGAIL
jgi:hypothetical protein